MSEQETALTVLIGQVDGHVAMIARGADKANCTGHAPLAAGVTLLLQIEKARFEAEENVRKQIEAQKVVIVVTFIMALGSLIWNGLLALIRKGGIEI